jgi:YHS domain-containing protein
MLWRFIVLGVLLVIVYFMVKSALRGLFGKGQDVTRSVGTSGTPSEMVQDPVCGMFIPKEGAYFLHQGNQTYFFCSETCRAGYQKKLSSA